jgi:hypothetical protein
MISTTIKILTQPWHLLGIIIPLLLLATGCEPDKTPPPTQLEQTAAPAAALVGQLDTTTNIPTPARAAVRINAGSDSPVTDAQGNVWAADQGFIGGEVVARPDLVITNTTEPEIYHSEHYSMDSFSWPLLGGKYLVKLHFAETFDGIEGPGQRVFSFNVQGHEFKDFDVWVKAGGPLKAYVETVPVEITGGKLLITFTGNIENPQINGIEIIPQSSP